MLINATEDAHKNLLKHVREKRMKMMWLLVVVLVGAAVAFGPSWTKAQEHVTLADLLELVGGKQYLERHVSVTTSNRAVESKENPVRPNFHKGQGMVCKACHNVGWVWGQAPPGKF